MHRAGAADVPCAAGARAHALRCLAGCIYRDRMTTHGEIVIGRPHQHTRSVGAQIVGKTVGTLLQRREDPVAPLASDRIEGLPAMLSEPTHSSEALKSLNSVKVRSALLPQWITANH